jgi:hypothetical protein
VVIFRSLSPTGVDFADIAATSDGGFYAQRASHSALRKYCGDGRLQWELLGIHRADGMLVEADDSVWLPPQDATQGFPTHLDATGHEIARYMHSDSLRVGTATLSFAGRTTVVTGIASRDETLLVRQGFVDGVQDWEVEFFLDAGVSRITPSSAFWVADRDAATLTLYRDGEPTTTAPYEVAVSLAVVGEDDSFLGAYYTGPSLAGIRRILADGSVAWTLPISEPFQYMTLDVDGRLYLYGSGHVIAVQTDVLPPSVRGCWQHRCSPRGDNRIEPLP